jgi:transcription initiation factor TFIID subunit TAF12
MYTKKVDMITEMSGAIAETQKSLLFFFPMYLATRRNARKDAPISIVCQFHCSKSTG